MSRQHGSRGCAAASFRLVGTASLLLCAALLCAAARPGSCLADPPPTGSSAGAAPSPSTPGSNLPGAPGTAAPGTAAAATAAAPAAEAWQPDNRVILSGDRDTLTGTRGGEGGSVGYLQELAPGSVIGAAAEYQQLANSRWAFGSVNAAYSHALTQSTRWSLHAEAHEGAGRAGASRFQYAIEAGGLGLAVPGGLGLDLEERRIDVQTSHGSLPKATLSEAFDPHWLATIAYARSYGGNLNTSYGLARLDFYGRGFSLFGGGDLGRVTPAVINIEGVLLAEAHHLREAFLGVTKTLSPVDVTLLGDELDLAGIRRLTLTLNLTVHLR